MNVRTKLQIQVDDYLAERRQLGFELRSMEYALISLASYVESSGHEGPLTAELMTEWARLDKKQTHAPATGARRIEVVRPFARWLCQFEPLTEVPDESAFGPVPGRVAPHIYREDEIVALLGPDGHFKFPHLWPVKFPQAGRLNYQLFGLSGSDFPSW